MPTSASRLLGDLLPGLHLLPTEQLAVIAASLGVTSQQALMALPVDPMGEAAREDLALKTAAAGWETWRGFTLRGLMPGIGALVGEPIESDLRGPLMRGLSRLHQGAFPPRWTDSLISSEPASWMIWPGVGLVSALQLLSAAIHAVISPLSAASWLRSLEPDISDHAAPATGVCSSPESQDSVFGVAVSDLSTFAAWAEAERGAGSLLAALALLSGEEELPPEVADAVNRLGLLDLKRLGGGKRLRFDSAAALRRILDGLDEREARVAHRRVLETDPRLRPTLEVLSNELRAGNRDRRITRERARQIEVNAIVSMRQASGQPENAVAARAARRLGARIGVAAPVNVVAAVCQDVVHPGVDAPAEAPGEEELRLLLHLAGPYTTRDDWLVLQSHRDLATTTENALLRAASQGPLDFPVAVDLAIGLGVRREYAPLWLASLRRVRNVEGHFAPWTGSLADKAYWILRLVGEPMDVPAVSAAIGEAHSVRGLTGRIGSDPRFVRTDMQHYGLAEWGSERYEGIVNEIKQELAACGGVVSVEHLVGTLTQRFGVAESSVRTYASGHWFVPVGAGHIRVRQLGDPFDPPPSIEATGGCFRLRSGWALRLKVTDDTLRGSGVAVREGLAGHLGLLPGGSVDVASPVGPVNFSWTGAQPAIGSQRELAQSLGCALGDYLFLQISEPGRDRLVAYRTRPGGVGPERLFPEIGAEPSDWGGNSVAAAAHALGLDPQRALPGDVRARFVVRGESELARLLPPDGDDESDGLLSALGL